jgi:YVTN family beta-propeller protein
VQGRPYFIDVSPDGHRAYVANSGSDNVSVLDLDHRAVVATLHVGRSPGLARVSPDGSTVVVTNRADNSVSIIDAAHLVVRSAINLCIHPEDVAILRDSSKAFISCSGSGQVASVELRKNNVKNQVANAQPNTNNVENDRLLALLDVGKSPVSLALKPDGGELIAFNFEAGSISIVETAANEVSGSYLVGNEPSRGVVSADNSRLYISNFGSNNIAVYDVDLGKIVAYLSVGTHPDALALSENQNYLLVLDSGSGDLAIIQKRTPKKKFEPSEYSLLTIIPVGMQPNQIVVKSFLATKLLEGR